MSLTFRLPFHHNQRGDTLVEVMISIAIVSLILGGAYVTTNNSLRATRTAEERTSAMKLVQGQTELVKSMVASPAGVTALAGAPPAGFCLVPNAVAGAQPSTPNATTAPCKLNSGGSPTVTEPIYSMKIIKVGNTYTISSTWSSVTNTGQDNVQMTYRAYPQ